MEIRPMTQEEQLYADRQSMQIQGQTGSIGQLMVDFGESGTGYDSAWSDYWEKYKAEDFQSELNGLVDTLRSEEYRLLANRGEMAGYVKKFPDSDFLGKGRMEHGFRADTERHAYLIRCNPAKGNCNIYCYISKYLDRHMENARQGIRFIEPDYKEKFRIPDGGKIILTTAWGKKTEKTCRFIDEYHTEVGSHLYHICQFAELMHKNGTEYAPKTEETQRTKKNRNQER